MKNISILFIAVFHLVGFLSGYTGTIKIVDTTTAIMQFDPYVSTLDLFNRSRYGVNDLIPLISIVATRFTRIYVELSRRYLHKESSLLLSPMAAATYNCLPTTVNKVQVYIGTTRINCSCKYFEDLRVSLAHLADEVNQACPQTVTTILIQANMIDSCKKSAKKCPPILSDITTNSSSTSLSKYVWGMLMPFDKFCNQQILFPKNFVPEIILIKYSNLEEMLQNDYKKCKTFINSSLQSVKFLKKLSVSDSNSDNSQNFTHFAKTWKNLMKDVNNTYVINKAFDTPYQYHYSGWWYLVNDSGNTNTSGYIFKEKIANASHIDNKENPKHFGWLREPKVLNKSSSGIILTGNVNLNVVTKDFCRALIVHGKYTETNLINSVPTVEFEKNCGRMWQLVLILSEMTQRGIEKVPETLYQNAVVLLPIRMSGSNIKYNSFYLDRIKESGLKYGYSFPLEICEKLYQLAKDSKHILFEILSDLNSTMYVFLFQEDANSIKIGATRMFRRRIVIFEECRKIVLKNRSNETEIGFAMQRYYKLKDFYKSPWAMQNFVKYIDLLDIYSAEKPNTIVFLSLDSDESRKQSIQYPSAGWYSYDVTVQKYISKREEALQLSVSTYEKPIGFNLSKIQIFGITIASLGFCVLIVYIANYITRKYYKKDAITREEIYQFFKGYVDGDNKEENLAHKLPYDKDKYEISNDKFKMNDNETLGCGEFGKVCRGTLSTANGKLDVAIKTTNPLKFHKSTINGLLSEIKILAYVGKHSNITELLGANTTNLKYGKVYVFLELCHLGSLEKVLKEINLSTETFKYATGKTYKNPDINQMLDESSLAEIFRWSTEICSGMVYLADMHVVHADLATRNVLLSANREAKICDFGLSRRMYNYTNYVKTGQEPLPWKWMSPESLRSMEFSEKSDVWAFGVTLWEIYSLGTVPYPGLSWDISFPEKLENGLRLPKPKYNELDMYELMLTCCNSKPNERPSFSQIKYWLTTRKNVAQNYAMMAESSYSLIN